MGLLRYIPAPIAGVLAAAKIQFERARRGREAARCSRREAARNGRPAEWAHRVLSQNGEDGIVSVILSKLEIKKPRFVEFGFGLVQGNMLASVFADAATGLFIDRDPKTCAAARIAFALLGRSDIRIRQAWIERDNIDQIIVEAMGPGEIDVLSIDVDGNDFWILSAIASVRPKVLIVEYNASFGPDRAVSIPYEPAFDRRNKHPTTMYYGASLTAFAKLANERGFALVGCEPTEPNAFFVRRDLLRNGLVETPVREAFRPSTDLDRQGYTPQAQADVVYSLPIVDV